MESGATDDSRSLLSPENNLPLQGDFPPPPSSPGFPSPPRMFTPPPDEQNGSLEDLSEKGLSFDNPLANFAMGGNASEDEDNFDFTDADAAIDKMLDDLQDFQNFLGPDSTDGKKDDFTMLSPTKKQPNPPPISTDSLDHLRFSMGNFEETPEVDLDALLEDLCVMERDIKESSVATLRRKGYNIDASTSTLGSTASSSGMDEEDGGDITQFHANSPSYKMTSPLIVTHDVKERLENLQNELESKELTPEEQEERIKAEKMKIALEKMKAASFQKLFIKVLNKDKQTWKTMMIDQTWTARDVTQKMISKDDVEMDVNWCIIEKLPDLNMERILEDHEHVLPTVLDWSRETENRLVFFKRRDKYMLFKNPQNFLLTGLNSQEDTKLAEKSKDLLLEEFFSKENTQIPQVEGVLWLRKGTKKWDKHYFALRASGIYYNAKGKQKTRELSCLVQFEHNNTYLGVNFKKNFKAPTDHVICLKHPKIQNMKSKHIFALCAEDNRTMYVWLTGIRMAKYGYNMYEDYLKTQEDAESVLLAGSRGALSLSSSSGFTESSTGSLMSVVSDKGNPRSGGTVRGTVRGTLRNAPKNADGSSQRVKGKQNSLADIFATAWQKGIAETTQLYDQFSPDVQSPGSPDHPDLQSPVMRSKTFDYSNTAITTTTTTTHGTTGEKLDLDPAPIGRRASQKSQGSTGSSEGDEQFGGRRASQKSRSSAGSAESQSDAGDPSYLPPLPPNLPSPLPDLPPPPEAMFSPFDDVLEDNSLPMPPPPDGESIKVPPPPPPLNTKPLPPPPPPLDAKPAPPPPPPLDAKPAPPPPPPLDAKPAPPPPPPLNAKPGRPGGIPPAPPPPPLPPSLS